MRLFAIVVLAAIVIAACKSTSNPVAIKPADYFPLSNGSTWSYATYQTDSLDNKIAGSDAVEYDTVIGTGTIQGRSVILVQQVSDTLVDTMRYYRAPNGDISTFLDTSTSGTPSGVWQVVYAKSDSTVGMTSSETQVVNYTYQGTPLAIPITTQHTLLASESLTVPAGTFQSQVRKDSSFGGLPPFASLVILTRSDVAPNVGVVKQISSTSISIAFPTFPAFASHSGAVRILSTYHVN